LYESRLNKRFTVTTRSNLVCKRESIFLGTFNGETLWEWQASSFNSHNKTNKCAYV